MHLEKTSSFNETTLSSAFWIEFRQNQIAVAWVCGGMNDSGFNLCKARRRGRNIIGHRAIINVPGQHGSNITICAATSQNGAFHRHALSHGILTFLDRLHHLITVNDSTIQHIVIWDKVVPPLCPDPQFTVLYFPPSSPFLNQINLIRHAKFFSTLQLKVYDFWPRAQMPLLQAMEEACYKIDASAVWGWICHSRHFFPRCLDKEDITCNINEIL